MAIADAYDAMIHDRPYKRAITHEQAIAELRRHAGTQFDPELVALFCDMYADVAPEPDETVLAMSAVGSAHTPSPLFVPGGDEPRPRRRRRSTPADDETESSLRTLDNDPRLDLIPEAIMAPSPKRATRRRAVGDGSIASFTPLAAVADPDPDDLDHGDTVAG